MKKTSQLQQIRELIKKLEVAELKTLERECREIVGLHEKMRNAYFFQPPGNANMRRSYEEYNSKVTLFSLDQNNYEIIQTTNCSCKNIYYKLTINVNDEYTNLNISFINKILLAINDTKINPSS